MTRWTPNPDAPRAHVPHACAAESKHGLGADCCPFDQEGNIKPEYNGDSGTVHQGWDVTMGGMYYGKVLRVIPPQRYSGDCGPRYLIRTDTGRERIVW